MPRGRKPNIRIDGAKLDEAIRNFEGDRYNRSKISRIIMGKDKTYYSMTVREGSINEATLNRVCEYYGFTAADFIVKDTPEADSNYIPPVAANTPVPITTIIPVDSENSAKIIELLTSIDATLKELVAAEKATQFILNDVTNNLIKSCSNQKTMMETLNEMSKRRNGHHNTVTKSY